MFTPLPYLIAKSLAENMHLPKYQLKSSPGFSSFEFTSEGPKGFIIKRIQFTLVNHQGVYNLSFGDKNVVTGQIDDLAVSNNGDGEKVLATVTNAVFAFLDQHPDAWIYATGSTMARTRLYQIGISRFLDEINETLEIYGQLGDQWYPFKLNQSYQAFLARRKNS